MNMNIDQQRTALLHQISLRNSNGVILLQQGNINGARDTFLHALGELKIICQEESAQQQQNNDNSDDGTKLLTLQDVFNHQINQTEQSCVNKDNVENDDNKVEKERQEAPASASATVFVGAVNCTCKNQCDDAMYSYDKAFICVSDFPCTTSAVAVVLLYNIGLVHHHAAIVSNQTTLYAKAIRFYEQAATLIENHDFVDHSNVMALILAAILNNLAHCHITAFCDKQMAAMYHRKLSDLISWMMQQQQEYNNSKPRLSMPDTDECDFFLTSLMFADLQYRSCQVASAA